MVYSLKQDCLSVEDKPTKNRTHKGTLFGDLDVDPDDLDIRAWPGYYEDIGPTGIPKPKFIG